MLAVLTVEGIIHEIRVDQDLGMMNVDLFDPVTLVTPVQLLLFIFDIRHSRIDGVTVSMGRK
jgi:hypothetical protein